MIKQVNNKIIELYGSKARFCDAENHKHKNFHRKLSSFENSVNKLNAFLKPLGLILTLESCEIKP